MSNRLQYCARCLTTFGEDGPACPNLSCRGDRPSEGWPQLLSAGDVLDRRYRILRPLAVGGAGLTYLAREIDVNGVAVEPDLAIKVLYTSRAEGAFLRRLSNEAQILQELDHDNIVTCMGFVQRVGMEPYLVTLFEKGGNLQTFIERTGPVSPSVAAGILRQILLALDVAHQRGVVHRDLKPDNVLLREEADVGDMPRVRLTDFGIAKIDGGLSSQLTQHGSFVGTPEYAAPEQFRGKPATAATDVFATGGLLLFLLTGAAPFQFESRTDIAASYRQIVEALPPQLDTLRPKGSETERRILQAVIDNTMVLDPDKRWTVHQVIAKLNGLLGTPTPRTLEITDQPAPDRERMAPAPSAHLGSSMTFTEAPEEGVGAMDSEPALAPTAPEPTRGGLWGVLFGGVAGLVLVWTGGGLLSLAILVVGAWGLGWFAPERPPVASIEAHEIDMELARERVDAVALLSSDDAAAVEARASLTRALDRVGPDMGRMCDARGGVVGTLLIRSNGDVAHVDLDPGYLGASETACVRTALLNRRLPNELHQAVLLRTAFSVDP
jgi:serine/threonine protein kinase